MEHADCLRFVLNFVLFCFVLFVCLLQERESEEREREKTRIHLFQYAPLQLVSGRFCPWSSPSQVFWLASCNMLSAFQPWTRYCLREGLILDVSRAGWGSEKPARCGLRPVVDVNRHSLFAVAISRRRGGAWRSHYCTPWFCLPSTRKSGIVVWSCFWLRLCRFSSVFR